MKLYLDMCSLQRPLDTKTQMRVAVEAEAILNVLAFCEAEYADLRVSDALVFETEQNAHQERDTGLLRIIDNSGEDYLYPASYFQPLDWHTAPAGGESGYAALTIYLDPRTKAVLRAEALAAHTSMGALVRQWIEERLELQSRREATR